MLCEKGLNAFGKKIRLVSACAVRAADMGRNLSLSLDFLNVNPLPNKP